jgi:hypothetical protein
MPTPPSYGSVTGVPNAAKKGNRRAVKHGTGSERMLAPVREEHAVVLRERYPKLDGIRLAFPADRLARIDLASAWVDGRGGVVRDEEGEIYPVVAHLDKWQQRAERMLTELEAEFAGPEKADLATQMSELEAGDD